MPRSRALRQHATAHVAGSKRAAARRGGCAVAGWWRRWSHKAEERWGAAVEADVQSGGAGTARAGKGLGAYLVERAVGTGGRSKKESNKKRTE